MPPVTDSKGCGTAKSQTARYLYESVHWATLYHPLAVKLSTDS